MPFLSAIVGWSVVVIVDLLAFIVLWRIAKGDIDLSMLISEPTGDASISRFQLLVFTYVIGLTLFWVTISRQPPAFPDITGGLLSLMGISASTYAVSKGIQFSADEGGTPKLSLDSTQASLTAGQQVTLTATLVGLENPSITWTYAPTHGNLAVAGNQATYTAPVPVLAPMTITITAASAQKPAVRATASVSLS